MKSVHLSFIKHSVEFSKTLQMHTFRNICITESSCLIQFSMNLKIITINIINHLELCMVNDTDEVCWALQLNTIAITQCKFMKMTAHSLKKNTPRNAASIVYFLNYCKSWGLSILHLIKYQWDLWIWWQHSDSFSSCIILIKQLTVSNGLFWQQVPCMC